MAVEFKLVDRRSVIAGGVTTANFPQAVRNFRQLTCHCVFPPEGVRVRPEEGRTDEASKVHGRADIAVLKEHEAGAKTADLARKHGISEATIYNWKAKFGGMDVSEAKRLRALEEENAKLKKLLAEQMLDAAALRELLSKKW
jgi:putative transposase